MRWLWGRSGERWRAMAVGSWGHSGVTFEYQFEILLYLICIFVKIDFRPLILEKFVRQEKNYQRVKRYPKDLKYFMI